MQYVHLTSLSTLIIVYVPTREFSAFYVLAIFSHFTVNFNNIQHHLSLQL